MYIYFQEKQSKRVPEAQYYQKYTKDEEGYPVGVLGTEIPRRPNCKWDIKYIENVKGGGKIQIHLYTLDYWDIVDGFGIDDYDIKKGISEKHPRATKEAIFTICKIVYNKYDEIEKIVKEHYKKNCTLEHKAMLLKKKLKDDTIRLQAERERQRQEKEYHKEQQRFKEDANSIDSSNYTKKESEIVCEMINVGWKELSKKYHPDVGGDGEKMKLINAVHDKLIKQFNT